MMLQPDQHLSHLRDLLVVGIAASCGAPEPRRPADPRARADVRGHHQRLADGPRRPSTPSALTTAGGGSISREASLLMLTGGMALVGAAMAEHRGDGEALEPVTAALVAAVVLGESLGPAAVVGMLTGPFTRLRLEEARRAGHVADRARRGTDTA